MNKLDKFYEAERFKFMCYKDGLGAGIFFAKETIKAYLGANIDLRRKYKRNFAYRTSYLESAFSLRYILRSLDKENLSVTRYERTNRYQSYQFEFFKPIETNCKIEEQKLIEFRREEKRLESIRKEELRQFYINRKNTLTKQ